jgi:cyclopropane fatty-acyl-phospholipid synthase-like methyltransferase
MDASKLNPGDKHYKAYVGPPTQYDFMGATQFRLLCTLGLREQHKVLDFGCGSLRAGRLLLSYL